MNDHSRSLIEVSLVYLVTAAIGVGVYQWTTGTDLLRFLYADLAMTLFIYAVSVAKRNSSTYDVIGVLSPFRARILILKWWSYWDWTQWGSRSS